MERSSNVAKLFGIRELSALKSIRRVGGDGPDHPERCLIATLRMNKKFAAGSVKSIGKCCLWLALVGLGLPGLQASSRAATAALSDAWWTFQQDCNGDGCKAGTLPGEKARLNWAPIVTNCFGT